MSEGWYFLRVYLGIAFWVSFIATRNHAAVLAGLCATPDPASDEVPDPHAKPDLLAGLPADLVRALRDPSIVIPQDGALWVKIAEWANAPSNTASAHLPEQSDA